MYYLFRLHNIEPDDYYWMKPGKRLILTAFLQREIEDLNNENGGGD